MPRKRKPARLYERPDNGEWVIRDVSYTERTGCFGSSNLKAAEAKLAAYLNRKAEGEPVVPRPKSEVLVTRVLTYYAENMNEDAAAPERAADAIDALALFWSMKTCEDVNEKSCRAYADWRIEGGVRKAQVEAGNDKTQARETASRSTARRELGVLRAALKKSFGNILTEVPVVWLPPETDPRPDWLTRSEFAAILWELWRGPRPKRKDGTLGRRQDRTKHAARIALCQFYTGSRPGTVGRSTWHRRTDGPWIDLTARIWHRRGDKERKTVKGHEPHGIPKRLFLHLARWRRLYDLTYVIEHPRHPREPIIDIGSALETASAAAGIKRRVTPHTLKHTAITLAIQSGMSAEDAADYFSTSLETIQKTYWHHSPHHQARAVKAMDHVGRGPAQIRTETPVSAQK